MKTAAIFSTVCVAALTSTTNALPFESREAGPSGSVISPAGGTLIKGTEQGQGAIPLEYECVRTDGEDAANYAVTFGVAASLVNGDQTYLLTNGEACDYDSKKATAKLQTPKGACGDFSLVLTETQLYQGKVITFQSAAPQIHIDCAVTP